MWCYVIVFSNLTRTSVKKITPDVKICFKKNNKREVKKYFMRWNGKWTSEFLSLVFVRLNWLTIILKGYDYMKGDVNKRGNWRQISTYFYSWNFIDNYAQIMLENLLMVSYSKVKQFDDLPEKRKENDGIFIGCVILVSRHTSHIDFWSTYV